MLGLVAGLGRGAGGGEGPAGSFDVGRRPHLGGVTLADHGHRRCRGLGGRRRRRLGLRNLRHRRRRRGGLCRRLDQALERTGRLLLGDHGLGLGGGRLCQWRHRRRHLRQRRQLRLRSLDLVESSLGLGHGLERRRGLQGRLERLGLGLVHPGDLGLFRRLEILDDRLHLGHGGLFDGRRHVDHRLHRRGLGLDELLLQPERLFGDHRLLLDSFGCRDLRDLRHGRLGLQRDGQLLLGDGCRLLRHRDLRLLFGHCRRRRSLLGLPDREPGAGRLLGQVQGGCLGPLPHGQALDRMGCQKGQQL